jgi:hypothetical protein
MESKINCRYYISPGAGLVQSVQCLTTGLTTVSESVLGNVQVLLMVGELERFEKQFK